jgi:site-specific recombinase XerD
MTSDGLAQQPIPEDDMLVADAIDAYLRQRAAEALSPASIATMRKTLRQLAHALAARGVRAVAEIVPADVEAFMLDLRDRGLAQSTRRTHATTIRECFRRFHADGLTLRNPALTLPVPEDEDVPLPEPPLEPAEVDALIAAIPRRDALDLRNRAIVEVLYGSGIRLTECLSLDVDDIDGTARVLHVRSGKGGTERTIPLMKGALGAIRDYLAVRRQLVKGPDGGALFLNDRGQRIGAFVVQQLLADLSVRAGLTRRVHPHLLRHSIAVAMLRGGADIRHVQALLGHSSIETTKVYLRMVPGHLREEYDRAMPTIAV